MTEWVESIEVDGRVRRCICHVPDRVTPGLPLLIVLHGRNLTIDEIRRITHFDALADRRGFVVAYPEGYKRSWNDGRSNSPAQEEGFDDTAFIRALIDRLGEKGIDTELIAATGLSNGGVLCQRLGLELSDRIGTIAPVAGLMPVSLAAVTPDHAVSVLQIQGTEDRSMPIEGGRARGRGRLLLLLGGVRRRAEPVLSLAGTVERWREIDGCDQRTQLDPLVPTGRDPTKVERVVYSGGRGGTVVESWSVVGGGHTWPGGPSFGGLMGRTTRHFDAGEVIWEFVRRSTHSAKDRRLS
ncbi:MAG TPA: PHB depolymerase family esterase [Chloroflexota bacterium]|nr:PHB depolymerase family esterase [Chloroflexota bacterium]